MKLLDTTFLIHYWAGHEEVEDYLDKNEESEFVTTTLNLKEIAVGRRMQDQFDRHEISAKFEWLTVVPFQVEHAFVAGELEARLHRDSSVNQDKINSMMNDLLIAAVARDLNATLVTRNVEDFQLFDGITVETY